MICAAVGPFCVNNMHDGMVPDGCDGCPRIGDHRLGVDRPSDFWYRLSDEVDVRVDDRSSFHSDFVERRFDFRCNCK